MTGWHLTTLGRVPALHHEGSGARIARLRSRRAFALLASLALDPATCTVDALAERLWPDAGDEAAAKANLRTAIRLLRVAAGGDLFASERGVVRLAPGALSGGVDLTDARDAFEAIRRASASLPPRERAERLRDVARALVAGGFLEGLDLGGPWIDGVRARADALRAEAHLSLALALEEAGDPAERRAAFEAAALAYALLPDLKGAGAALLRLQDAAPPGGERADLAAEREDLADLLDAPSPPRAATVREERALDAAMDAALRPFPEAARVAFARLGVFPQSFTPEQARAVGGAEAEAATLAALADAGLLRRQGGDRFEIPAAARGRVLARLSPAQRRTAAERHARFFVRHVFDGLRPLRRDDPTAVRWMTEEGANWRAALGERLKRPLDRETYLFIDLLGFFAGALGRSVALEIGRAASARFEEAYHARVTEDGWPEAWLAAHAHQAGDFAGALRWARIAFDSQFSHPARDAADEERRAGIAGSLSHVVFHALTAAHHGGDDGEFDAAAEMAEFTLRALEPWPERRWPFRSSIAGVRAENLYARRRYEEALAWSDQEVVLLEETIPDHPDLVLHRPGALYRRGCILARMGPEREDEALAAFDAALALYRADPELWRHGIADCLQQTAAILGKRPGLSALALRQAEEAVAIYESLGEHGSRAAALGTLGDLLAHAGRTDEARALYEEGRAHWQGRGHDRWVSRFDERLARLGAPTGSSAGTSPPPG